MYKFTNSGQESEILLYSLIEGGITAGKLIKALKDTPADSIITLRINSDGGEIFDAIAMYNYLKDRTVHVIIDGLCASAASIVAMAGKTITMKQGSMLMIHNPLTIAIGESEDLRAQADILDKLTESIVSIYQTKTHMEHDEIVSLMKSETWMNETEALAYGFVDFVDTQPAAETQTDSLRTDSTDFVDGVAAERKRIFDLDQLYTPGRASIINEAKYKTGKTAEQIAIEILKAEAACTPKNGVIQPKVNSLPVSREQADLDAFMDAVNRKKGR